MLLLVGGLLAPGIARAGTMHVTDFNARVLPASGPAFERAPWPSHRITVGDHIQFVALVCHDAPIHNVRISFTTTAPITGYQPPALNSGLFTVGSPTEPCGFTHTMWGGSATFTTAGRYTITFNVAADGADPASRTFDLNVDDLPRAVQQPLVAAACLRPTIRITSPTAVTGLCLDRVAHVNAQVTLQGCAPYTLTVSLHKPDGTTQVLPPRTSAPWSVTFTPTEAGTYEISAEIKDRNGASSTATVSTAARRCVALPFVQPKH